MTLCAAGKNLMFYFLTSEFVLKKERSAIPEPVKSMGGKNKNPVATSTFKFRVRRNIG
jgi:hypothetical protein